MRFYQLWFGFLSISLTIAIMGNYSKVFGMKFINDDHYFANVAIVQNILNGLSRVGWGYNYDRDKSIYNYGLRQVRFQEVLHHHLCCRQFHRHNTPPTSTNL